MLFKRKKKNIEHVGAKTFSGKINTIEIAKNGKVLNSFSRPSVVEIELTENEKLSFIADITKFRHVVLDNGKNYISENEIYLNGINVNQINDNYIDKQIAVIENNLPDKEDSKNINVLLKQTDLLSDTEKASLNYYYNLNPSVIIFADFKLDLPEKKVYKFKKYAIRFILRRNNYICKNKIKKCGMLHFFCF